MVKINVRVVVCVANHLAIETLDLAAIVKLVSIDSGIATREAGRNTVEIVEDAVYQLRPHVLQ